MGGKHKQAQRVKNNARPSSSSRSAELLSSTLSQQFLSTAQMKEKGFITSTLSLPSTEDIDPTLDTNFQLVLKKMNKKDATTKLKALQEFTELVKQSEAEAIKAILPFWPRNYCMLATDMEHKVREASHIAHNEVVLKVKRNIAPYLKQLAGAWFTSQYDTYPPAASAATKAFKDAFPVYKVKEVIIFCQEEILNYIFDNLVIHTPQSLSNPKLFTPEECKSRYNRLLIASLHGYSLFINEVSSEMDKTKDLSDRIIASKKFWALAHYDDPQIRAAFYSLLTNLCEKVPFLLKGHEGNLVKVVLCNLDEKELLVQGKIWQCALLVFKNFDDCSKHINYSEKVLPKLWKVLKEAGYGNASVIYPNLLPLMSRLSLEDEIDNFSFKFFDSMKQGLRQNSVRVSISESRAVCVAFVECLQYTIMQNHTKQTLCSTLIKNQLLPLLELYLDDSKAAHKTLFSQISVILQHWYKYLDDDHPNYAKYIEIFWCECGKLLKVQFTKNVDDDCVKKETLEQIASRHVQFIISLRHPSAKQKSLKVQFNTGDNVQSERRDSKCSLVLNEAYLMALKDFAFGVCIFFVKLVNGKRKLAGLMDNVCALLQEFDDPDIMDKLKKDLFNDPKVDSFKVFDLLFQFLNDEELCTKSTMNLLFFLLKYSDAETKTKVLDQLLKIFNEDSFGLCALFALSHPYYLDPVIQNWLKNEQIGHYFLKILDNEIQGTSSPDSSLLLRQVFSVTVKGDLFIQKSCITEMLNRLITCLKDPLNHTPTIDIVASFASFVSTVIYTDAPTIDYGPDLFLALLTLDCKMDDSTVRDFLSKDTLWEANASWQDAFCAIASKTSQEEFLQFCQQCFDVFERQVNENDDFNHKKIVDFVFAVEKSRPLLLPNILNLIHRNQFILNTEVKIHKLADVYLHIGNKLCFDKKILLEEFNYREDLLNYFKWKLISIKVLQTEIPNEDFDIDDDEYQQIANETILKYVDKKEQVIGELLGDLTVLGIITDNIKHVSYHKKLMGILEKINEYFLELLKNSPDETKNTLGEFLKKKVQESGGIWTLAIYHYFNEIKRGKLTEVFEELSGKTNFPQRMQLTQVFTKNHEITYDEMSRGLNDLESIVTLSSLSHCDDIGVQIAQVYARIEKLRDETYKTSFYNLNLGDWELIQHLSETSLMFSSLIQNNKENELSRRQWDFVLVSLGSWTGKLQNFKTNLCWNKLHVMKFIICLCDLYIAIDNYVINLDPNEKPDNQKFIDEWNDVFNKSITTDFMDLWMYFSEFVLESVENITNEQILLFQKFGLIILHMQPKYVFDSTIEGMPKWSKVLKQCCRLLVSPIHCLQLWGYHMLKILSPGLISVDCIAVDTNTPHEKGLIFEQFKDLLVETHTVVSTMLLEFRLGENSCRVQPFTDSYIYTTAYLLLWDILIGLCEKSSTELRYQYSDWLKKEDLLSSLISSLFKLMPLEVLQSMNKPRVSLSTWFIEKPSLSLNEATESDQIERLACWVYSSSLAQLPANVRHWWSNADSRISQLVERVTSLYVSQQLCVRELQDVSKYECKFKNMIVKVLPSVREVVAIYTVDEAQMELIITLPLNYPLGGPDVQCNRQIGGLAHKQWLMQLRMCLLHQNGRIWDAISLWNQNLDKKFDGVEECYICFAVLHPGTYQIPKLSCKTCRKKFHAACLYKWFNTSNKSTCPICRNLF